MANVPDISIVLLTRNAGPQFRATLSQIFKQEVEGSFEVVLVDSGSTDETLAIAREFATQAHSIPPAEFNFGLTRNYAFSLARGKYIVTLSQDAVPFDNQWLKNMVQPFAAGERIVAVQGTTRNAEEADGFFWEKTNRFYFTSDIQRWLAMYPKGLSFVNCAVRRDFWNEHPIAYTPFSEDKYFERMIYAAGKEVARAPDAICIHGHNYNLRSLVRRLKGEGIGWKYAGLDYTLKDCLKDLYTHKRMIAEAPVALLRGEVRSLAELLFPILRPICIYWGNQTAVVRR